MRTDIARQLVPVSGVDEPVVEVPFLVFVEQTVRVVLLRLLRNLIRIRIIIALEVDSV